MTGPRPRNKDKGTEHDDENDDADHETLVDGLCIKWAQKPNMRR